MSAGRPNIDETRLLPQGGTAGPSAAGSPAPLPHLSVAPAPTPTSASATTMPARQLQDLPKDELAALAEEFGLDPRRSQTHQHLVAAVHERRQLIASMDRDALLDCVRWGRRPVPLNATKEQIAQEIVRIRSMNFAGLSQRGLVVLARLRGVLVSDNDDVPTLVKKLKKQEGFFTRLNRKRRSVLAGIVSNMIGEDDPATDYRFLPPQENTDSATTSSTVSSAPSSSGAASGGPSSPYTPRAVNLREEIEESGLFGGIASRIRKSADSYVNQKLDEIEARIDRKLDEIDRRLAEWRDKELANRIRILKITLWASLIVAAISLLYSYIKVVVAWASKGG